MPKLVSALDAEPFPFSEEKAEREATWTVDKILLCGGQWAVTTYGVENITGPYHYHIDKSSLRMRMGGSGSWVDHMANKNWVDIRDFRNVFEQALTIHRGAE